MEMSVGHWWNGSDWAEQKYLGRNLSQCYFVRLGYKNNQLMLYGEIIAVCSQIHTEHTNTLCGQNVELLHVKLVVHIVTTGL
jgi:hypothetical protein